MRLLVAVALSIAAAVAYGNDTRPYGKPMPDGEAVPISAAITAHADYVGKPQRYSGRIAEVCQKEGCWMVLENDGQIARVMMRDHAFAIPKDAAGTAEVYGVLSRTELTPEAAKHMQEESKNRLPVAEVEYRIVADGVEISG